MIEPALLVADAIVARLAAVEWDLSTLFARTYLDEVPTINDEARRVYVMPSAIDTLAGPRAGLTDELHTTWLLFAARVPDATADTLDPVVDLTRAIRNNLADWPLKREPGFEKYQNAGLQTAELYDYDALRQHSVFLQLFGFRWRWER